MALIPPRFLDCILAIGEPQSDGTVFWMGTGCIFGYPYEEKNADGDTQYLAVFPLRHQVLADMGIKFSCFGLDVDAADKARLIDIGIAEGDHTFVAGYPLGFPTAEHPKGKHFVLVRSATVSRIRHYLEGYSKDFKIDTSNFPGNSGGPVIIKPETVAVEGTKPQLFPYVIGLVSAYIPHNSQIQTTSGDLLRLKDDFTLIVQDSSSSKMEGKRIISSENSGLAIVQPIEYVSKLIQEYPHPEIGIEYDKNLTPESCR